MLLTSGLMLGVYAILRSASTAGSRRSRSGSARSSLALLAAFVFRQSRIANPLMPLRLFRSRNVVGANIVMALLVVGMFGMFFLGALYLQRILGYDPLEVGLAFLPGDDRHGRRCRCASRARLHALRRRARRWSPRLVFDRRRRCCCSRARRSTATTSSTCCRSMLLFGFGAGLGFPALMTLAMSGATPSDAGLASGLVNTTPQVGGAIGLAVLATLAADRTDDAARQGDVGDAALNSGYHLAYLVGAGARRRRDRGRADGAAAGAPDDGARRPTARARPRASRRTPRPEVRAGGGPPQAIGSRAGRGTPGVAASVAASAKPASLRGPIGGSASASRISSTVARCGCSSPTASAHPS